MKTCSSLLTIAIEHNYLLTSVTIKMYSCSLHSISLFESHNNSHYDQSTVIIIVACSHY